MVPDDDDHLPTLFQLPRDKLVPNVSVGRSTAASLSIIVYYLLTSEPFYSKKTSELCVPTKIQTWLGRVRDVSVGPDS
jgi:hypothetical protein